MFFTNKDAGRQQEQPPAPGSGMGSGPGNEQDDRQTASGRRAELMGRRIKALKNLLQEDYGEVCAGCNTKEQFVDRIVELAGARVSARGSDRPPAQDEL